MSMFLSILLTMLLTFVLNIVIIQSNNFIFCIFKRPSIWIVFMGLLPILYFFIGSVFENSFNIIWWSAFLAFIINIPPKIEKDNLVDTKETKKMIDDLYEHMGIKKGGLKYRIGLAAYVVGGTLGWVLFYGKVVQL